MWNRSLVGNETFRSDQLDLFWWFVRERQDIWKKRTILKDDPPWTADAILQTNRFTNVYRELDPGTRYAIQHILEVDAPTDDKIFNIMLYRLIGRSETHARLGFQRLATFSPPNMERRLKELRDRRHVPVFTAAYMVSGYTSMGSTDKIENVVRLFASIRENFPTLARKIGRAKTPEEVYLTLRATHGFGNFLAYQVLVDLLYPLRHNGNKPLLPFSHDDWAAAGPGARAGISMLVRRPGQADNLEVMRWLRANQRAEFSRLSLEFSYLLDEKENEVEISLANIQNCLCEFHKYVKIKNGTGRARRKFAAPQGQEQPSLLAFEDSGAHDPARGIVRR